MTRRITRFFSTHFLFWSCFQWSCPFILFLATIVLLWLSLMKHRWRLGSSGSQKGFHTLTSGMKKKKKSNSRLLQSQNQSVSAKISKSRKRRNWQKMGSWIFGILDSLTLLSKKKFLYMYLKRLSVKSDTKSIKKNPTKIKEWTIIINQANVHYIVNIW